LTSTAELGLAERRGVKRRRKMRGILKIIGNFDCSIYGSPT